MTLADVVVDQFIFYAIAPDEDVNLDVAVRQMESIVADLSMLPPREISDVLGVVRSRIEGARTPDEKRALLDLLDNLTDP